MAEVLPVAFLVSTTFSVIFASSEGQKYFRKMCTLFCRPTRTRNCFHDVQSWHLIFLLNSALCIEILHFNLIHSHLKMISQYFHIESHELLAICVYKMKARHVDVSIWK